MKNANDRSPVAALTLLMALASCQSAATTAGVPGMLPASSVLRRAGSDASAGHLYVAIVTATRRTAIDRFALRNGIPQAKPDRVFQGSSGYIAVSGHGTLYATLGQAPIAVDVFSPDRIRPVRHIRIEPRCGPSSFTVINAIATDKNGYLFVVIYSYPGASPENRTPCNGIAVYAPNAKGRAQPVQTIRLANAAGTNGLAVDANDNLYVSENYPSEVDEYSNAIVNPTRTRTFSGQYLGGIRSVATDAAGDLFIGNAENSYSSAWINRYLPSASGSGPPANTIDLAGSGPHLLYSIAVRHRYLYADDSQQFANPQNVDLYYARKNGVQSPFYSLQEPKIDSIAVGP